MLLPPCPEWPGSTGPGELSASNQPGIWNVWTWGALAGWHPKKSQNSILYFAYEAMFGLHKKCPGWVASHWKWAACLIITFKYPTSLGVALFFIQVPISFCSLTWTVTFLQHWRHQQDLSLWCLSLHTFVRWKNGSLDLCLTVLLKCCALPSGYRPCHACLPVRHSSHLPGWERGDPPGCVCAKSCPLKCHPLSKKWCCRGGLW